MAQASEITFCIARVIGNELPPRDEEGSKLRALRHVLAADHEIPAPTVWLVNHIHNPAYRAAVFQILAEFGQTATELRFDAEIFRSLASDDDKIRYAININAARNMVTELALAKASFAVVVDQDCFFTSRLWAEATDAVLHDQAIHDRRYYGLMMKRMIPGSQMEPDDLPDQEPNVIFRRDAPGRFDPAIRFGNNDKMELLHRLGYGDAPGYVLVGDECITAGKVLHISYSEARIEKDQEYRIMQRRESLSRLVAALSRS